MAQHRGRAAGVALPVRFDVTALICGSLPTPNATLRTLYPNGCELGR